MVVANFILWSWSGVRIQIDPADVKYAWSFQNQASFWQLEQALGSGGSFFVWIKPHRSGLRVPERTLDLVIFSARLLGESHSYSRSLPPPILHKDRHTYKLAVPPHFPRMLRANYTLGILLQFGHDPFTHGRVCPADECSVLEILQLANSESKPEFSGEFVTTRYGGNISFELGGVTEEKKRPCRNLSSLPGAWMDRKFFPDECDLISVEELQLYDAVISKSSPNSVSRNHLVANSVIRVTRRTPLKLLHMKWSYYSSLVEKWGLSNELGVVQLEGNRTIVITYHTWFRCDNFNSDCGDAGMMKLLDTVVNPSTFGDIFDDTKGIAELTFIHPTGPPDKIYISMGAHSIDMMEGGFTKFWRGATPILTRSKNLSLLLHTSVDASLIPKKFGPQALLSTNFYLSWLNRELRARGEVNRVGVVDWESMTRGAVGSFFRDAVHTVDPVLEAMSTAIMTDWLWGG